jgi:hypothetical protein
MLSDEAGAAPAPRQEVGSAVATAARSTLPSRENPRSELGPKDVATRATLAQGGKSHGEQNGQGRHHDRPQKQHCQEIRHPPKAGLGTQAFVL